MVETAKVLLSELDGIYAYTESDEISVWFPPDWDLFDRSLEKYSLYFCQYCQCNFHSRRPNSSQF